MAELGIVAASWGTVLVSGSGVLVVGEVGAGFSNVRGFLWKKKEIDKDSQCGVVVRVSV